MDKNEISRRKAIKGLGVTLAAAAAAPAFASPKEDTPGAVGLQDPTTKFPKPPFNKSSLEDIDTAWMEKNGRISFIIKKEN